MMSSNVKVNTLFQKKKKRFVDPLSKCYIGLGIMLGLNRVPVILNKGKYILTFFVVVYSVILVAIKTYKKNIDSLTKYKAIVLNDVEYGFCVVFSLIFWKRLERYYNELNNFDIEIGCRSKNIGLSIKNFVYIIVFSVLFTSFYFLTYVWRFFGRDNLDAHYIPEFLLHFLELSYYGHLFSLLVSRLRLVNFFIAEELSNRKSFVWPNIQELESSNTNVNQSKDIEKLMDLYHITIKAHDFLIDAIKWQLLVVIMTSFVSTLTFCVTAAMVIISKENPLTDILWSLSMIVGQMLPLFSPCIVSDQLHGEVRRLRELLAARMYENNLDKLGRSAARAFLMLTNSQDLSFSLMGIFKVDISLPFKFIGLLVTYLIITLQLQKVFNPPSGATPSE